MKATTTTALALAALISLSACSAQADRSGVTSADIPDTTQSPQPALTLPPESPAPDSPMSAQEQKPGTRSAEEKRHSSEDCVMAAAGVASIMLAPSSFIYGTDSGKLDDLEAQLAGMRTKVPAELQPHIRKLQSVVERNRKDPGNFHSEEFRSVAQPIEDWLRANCDQ